MTIDVEGFSPAATHHVTDLSQIHIARNQQTRDQPSFAFHRAHVMRLIAAAASDILSRRSDSISHGHPLTISIAGAGNCQDIDIAVLAELFAEIRLIDIDAAAVNLVVSKCPPGIAARIRVFAPIDIAAPLLSNLAATELHSESSQAFLTALQSPSLSDEIPVSDVVVSACILSQLIDTALQIVLPEAPEFLPLIQAVRRGHLARLLELTVAGGRTLLITDLVSSDTVPALHQTPPVELPKLMFHCLQTGNFFSGLSPAVIQNDLQTIPTFAERCASFQIQPPWLWQLGNRSFAVYAVDMQRAARNEAIDGLANVPSATFGRTSLDKLSM